MEEIISITEKVLQQLCSKYKNTKLVKLETTNFFSLYHELEDSSYLKPIILRINQFSVMYGDLLLFELQHTHAIQYNAYSVIRDMIKLLKDHEHLPSRGDVQKFIIFV